MVSPPDSLLILFPFLSPLLVLTVAVLSSHPPSWPITVQTVQLSPVFPNSLFQEVWIRPHAIYLPSVCCPAPWTRRIRLPFNFLSKNLEQFFCFGFPLFFFLPVFLPHDPLALHRTPPQTPPPPSYDLSVPPSVNPWFPSQTQAPRPAAPPPRPTRFFFFRFFPHLYDLPLATAFFSSTAPFISPFFLSNLWVSLFFPFFLTRWTPLLSKTLRAFETLLFPPLSPQADRKRLFSRYVSFSPPPPEAFSPGPPRPLFGMEIFWFGSQPSQHPTG